MWGGFYEGWCARTEARSLPASCLFHTNAAGGHGFHGLCRSGWHRRATPQVQVLCHSSSPCPPWLAHMVGALQVGAPYHTLRQRCQSARVAPGGRGVRQAAGVQCGFQRSVVRSWPAARDAAPAPAPLPSNILICSNPTPTPNPTAPTALRSPQVLLPPPPAASCTPAAPPVGAEVLEAGDSAG